MPSQKRKPGSVQRTVLADERQWNDVREALGVHGSISELVRDLLEDWLRNGMPRYRYGENGRWHYGMAPGLIPAREELDGDSYIEY